MITALLCRGSVDSLTIKTSNHIKGDDRWPPRFEDRVPCRQPGPSVSKEVQTLQDRLSSNSKLVGNPKH